MLQGHFDSGWLSTALVELHACGAWRTSHAIAHAIAWHGCAGIGTIGVVCSTWSVINRAVAMQARYKSHTKEAPANAHLIIPKATSALVAYS